MSDISHKHVKKIKLDKCCEVLFIASFSNANTALAEISSNTIIVGDFNTQSTSIDRSSRQKINNEIMVLILH